MYIWPLLVSFVLQAAASPQPSCGAAHHQKALDLDSAHFQRTPQGRRLSGLQHSAETRQASAVSAGARTTSANRDAFTAPGQPEGAQRLISHTRHLTTSDNHTDIPVEWYPKPLFPSTLKPGKRPGKFHWVVVCCDRADMGRFLSTTLLTGISNGLQAASISILWCHTMAHMRQHKKPLPDLLYNMWHGGHIRVFMPSDELYHNVTHKYHDHKVHLSTMLIPYVLGDTSLPVIVTEEDILWVPQADRRIDEVLAALPHRNKPFAISMFYMLNAPFIEINQKSDLDKEQWVADDLPIEDSKFDGSGSHFNLTAYDKPYSVWFEKYHWSTLALYFSPDMVDLLARSWAKALVYAGVKVGQEAQTLVLKGEVQHNWIYPPSQRRKIADAHLLDMIYNYLKCTYDLKDGNAKCYFAMAGPSLVQHMGTSTMTQHSSKPGHNSKFILTREFPVRVSWPAYDKTW